jgi:hypothetical protein
MVRGSFNEIRFASGALAVLLFSGIVLIVYEIEEATVRMVAGSVCLSVAFLLSVVVASKADTQFRECCPVCGSSGVTTELPWRRLGVNRIVWREPPSCVVCLWNEGSLIYRDKMEGKLPEKS